MLREMARRAVERLTENRDHWAREALDADYNATLLMPGPKSDKWFTYRDECVGRRDRCGARADRIRSRWAV